MGRTNVIVAIVFTLLSGSFVYLMTRPNAKKGSIDMKVGN